MVNAQTYAGFVVHVGAITSGSIKVRVTSIMGLSVYTAYIYYLYLPIPQLITHIHTLLLYRWATV